MGLFAYAAALVITLVLAAFLTPAHWWRRANARAAALLVVGTWGIGGLISGVLVQPQKVEGATLFHPTGSFRVYQDLNLRAASGTAALRVAVVPAGALVTSTGAHEGDWWELSASVDGKPVRGWASSLWLRRPDERRR
ncbi:MAG: SH3 domain-containing protein [Pseudomonadota bacterium]